MKRFICLLSFALALPAYAGHGTIEETDDAVIVEYVGDPSDSSSDGRSGGAANAAASASASRTEDQAAMARGDELRQEKPETGEQTKETRRRPGRGRYRHAASATASETAE